MKILRVEGVGRYYLSTGKTISQGWRTLGSWTSWYFVPYIVIWGIVYGATAMSSTALPLAALFPALDLKVFAIAAGLIPRLPTEDDGMFYVLALAERYGQAWSVVFLIGFFAASARFYLLMVTFPTMALLFFDQPILLILLYGTLGAIFMPFLAITLLFLNNQKRYVPPPYRNRWFQNVFLGITAGVFVAVGVYELYEALAPIWS